MNYFRELKKYFKYARYSAICELKSQVAGSYLGWLWWILEPLLFMFVYTFVVEVVFQVEIAHFPLFVFLGLAGWNYFNASVQSSVGAIQSYAAVVKKVFIPKHILILSINFVNLFKMFITLALSIIAALVVGIKLSENFFYLPLIIVVYFVFTLGISCIVAHFGTHIKDLTNVMTVGLRFLFYFSGVFYSLEQIPPHLATIYQYICPTGFVIGQLRNVIMYEAPIDFMVMLYWLLLGIGFLVLGINLLHHGEKNYMKVI